MMLPQHMADAALMDETRRLCAELRAMFTVPLDTAAAIAGVSVRELSRHVRVVEHSRRNRRVRLGDLQHFLDTKTNEP